jgi:hypothetical protein
LRGEAKSQLGYAHKRNKNLLQKPTQHFMQVTYTLLQMFSSSPFVRSVKAMVHCVYTELNDAKTQNRLQLFLCFHRTENNSEFQCAKLVFNALPFGVVK